MDGGEEVRVRTTAKVGERKSGRVILNTRELTEQIHLPTLSFSVSISLPFPHFTPLICLSFLFSFSLSHLFLLSPPTPLISSKILLHLIFLLFLTVSPHSHQKKNRLTLMNRWREEGSDCIEGAQERLDQRFLDQRLFTQDSPMWSCQSVFLPFFFLQRQNY